LAVEPREANDGRAVDVVVEKSGGGAWVVSRQF
jgi:hypothetical protein